MSRGKHYNVKFNNKVIKPLMKNGFECKISCKNGNKFWIFRDNGPRYMVHSGGGEKIYELKRFLKDHYNYDFI